MYCEVYIELEWSSESGLDRLPQEGFAVQCTQFTIPPNLLDISIIRMLPQTLAICTKRKADNDYINESIEEVM